MTAVIEASGSGGVRVLKDGVTKFSTDDRHLKVSASGPLIFHNGQTFDQMHFCEYNSNSGAWGEVYQTRVRDLGLTFDEVPAYLSEYDIPAMGEPLRTRGEVQTVGIGGTGEIDGTAGRMIVKGPGGTFDTADQHLHLVRYFQGTLNWAAPGLGATRSQSDQVIGPVTAQENVVIGVAKMSFSAGSALPPPVDGRWVAAGGTICGVIYQGFAFNSSQSSSLSYTALAIFFDFIITGGNLVCRRRLRLWDPARTVYTSINAKHNADSGPLSTNRTQQLDYRIYTGAWT